MRRLPLRTGHRPLLSDFSFQLFPVAPLHLFALALIAAFATGCGGFQASKSFSPLDFILPGLHIQNCPAPPVLPPETNTVPLLAQASHVPP